MPLRKTRGARRHWPGFPNPPHTGCAAGSNNSADAVKENLKKELQLQPLGSEGEGAAEWILVDYVDFVVNIFSAEWRKKYALEKLWMDAKRYEFSPDL